jgi:RNA polymerase sigma-70 factor (ECF subfamily)
VAAGPDFLTAYDNHVWDVYGFFAYRLGSRADAEDLTQVTFERALRAWHRYDPRRAALGTWLLAIARNLLIDHYRLRRVRHEELVEAAPEVPVADFEPGLGVSPELADALRGLTEREREVIALRFGGDLSGPEIAEILALTVANVQQILSRTLRKLRTRLEEPASTVNEGGG